MVFTRLAIGAHGSIELEGDFDEHFVRDVLASWRSQQPGPSTAEALAVMQADIKALKEADVTQKDNLAALATRLDAATNEIANDLKELRDKVANGTVSDADLAPLDANIAKLEGLGADPDDIVPQPQQPVE